MSAFSPPVPPLGSFMETSGGDNQELLDEPSIRTDCAHTVSGHAALSEGGKWEVTPLFSVSTAAMIPSAPKSHSLRARLTQALSPHP